MKSKKRQKRVVDLPGIGKIKIGPGAVPVRGETAPFAEIEKALKKATKEKAFPPPEVFEQNKAYVSE